MNKSMMDDIMVGVVNAANRAGAKQLAKLRGQGPAFSVHNTGLVGEPTTENCVGHILDVCGIAWLKFDGRSPVVRYAKEVGMSADKWYMFKDSCYGGYFMGIRTCNIRQEMSVNIAEMEGAAEVLRSYGFKVEVNSRID